jgi:DNA-binding CsgD family transcriptional regulator
VKQHPEMNRAGPHRLLSTLERLLAIDPTELEPALQESTQIVAEVLDADKADVFLYQPERQSLVAQGSSRTPLGRKQREIGMDRLPLAGRGLAVEVFRTGKCYRTGRADKEGRELAGFVQVLGIRSEILVPVHVDGQPCGVLVVASVQEDFFSEEETAFLQAVSRWLGMVMHSAQLAEALMRQAEDRGRREGTARLMGQLTQRQREVAILIANGYSNQEIAHRLVVTPGTVANHVAQVLGRLGMDRRTQVATMVAELGLHRQPRNQLGDDSEPEWPG